jgi:methylmalonyl-CoA mutase
VDTVRNYNRATHDAVEKLRQYESLVAVAKIVPEKLVLEKKDSLAIALKNEIKVISEYDHLIEQYVRGEYTYVVRGKDIKVPTKYESLSHSMVSKVGFPKFHYPSEKYTFIRRENLPGFYPFAAGVFPFKRADEDPKRQFAGEGGPSRTNARFHYLSKNDTAKRLSTAFDSVTLYGEDPAVRPDIYGKIGESGVSICTLEDMMDLYKGFDLLSPATSVSMTINGPAPIILAMFMNTAINRSLPLTDQENKEKMVEVMRQVRGTVQADILKEDQAQNTCIFSLEFALKMMGDVQEFFCRHKIKNYYTVSISGYHIAEAGANPITQLALTLSNGFTYVEYYLSRGLLIDDFCENLSFFFSNGLDPEYTVLGRVARKIWAVTMKERYGASDKSQKLKYHIQTSGRSLHAQEIDFNDIRTTLQAFLALSDNCNSLHTNAYDEAITTPTEESVRRAMGAYIVDELADIVEESVLAEFERISDKGGVLGAMESMYQRGKIQEESLYYETLKDSGAYPIIGVNTFLPEKQAEWKPIELSRASSEEKNEQIRRLDAFKTKNSKQSPDCLKQLRDTALSGGNIFEELLTSVRYCSLGEITSVLYEVGGRYRRNM